MGGGDLNMKKHFHPLTMQNLERVWKAEQKAKEEKERTEQLQQELAEERRREELQKHAIEKGIIKQKSNRLDWMYAGPSVNHEEYLLGKKIDKNIDIMKDESESKEGSNVPESESSVADTTTDLLAKIKEDPLFLIKKKEDENRKELVQNPMKLKKLKEMLKSSLDTDDRSSRKKLKKSKKRMQKEKDRKLKRHTTHSDSHGDDYRHTSMISDRNGRRLASHRRRDSDDGYENSRHRVSNEAHSSSISPDEAVERNHRQCAQEMQGGYSHSRRSSDGSASPVQRNPKKSKRSDGQHNDVKPKSYGGRISRNRDSSSDETAPRFSKQSHHSRIRSVDNEDTQYRFSQTRHHKDDPDASSSVRQLTSQQSHYHRKRSVSRDSSPTSPPKHRRDRRTERAVTTSSRHSSAANGASRREKSNSSRKLTAEELEAKRQAMIDNARWRDDQRGENIKKYKKIDDEDSHRAEAESKAFKKDSKAKFIRDIEVQTYSSPATTSVEDRIKRNIYSKQRTSAALDKKFTHR